MLATGQKVTFNGTPAEVIKVFKNGRVRVAFWVQTFGMTKPELWKETVSAKSLAVA